METTLQKAVFACSKAILQLYALKMVIVREEPRAFCLAHIHMMKNNKQLCFGSATIEKNDVSFHRIPLYACPVLLHSVSDGLKARTEGKGCFNFKKVNMELFENLPRLTQWGFERFRSKEKPGRVNGRQIHDGGST